MHPIRSSTPLCREIVEHGLDKDVIAKAVLVYLDYLLKNARYDEALNIIENTYRKGIRTDEIERLHDLVSGIVEFKRIVETIPEIVSNITSIPASEIRKILDKALDIRDRLGDNISDELGEYIDKVIDILKDSVDVVSFYDGYVSVMPQVYSMLNEFTELMTRAEEEKSLPMIQNAFEYGKDNIPRIIPYLTGLLDNLNMMTLRTDTYKPLVDELRSNIESMINYLKDVQYISEHGLTAVGYYSALLNNLSHYGEGNNVLADKSYYNMLRDDIASILRAVKHLREHGYNTDAKEIADSLSESLINSLNKLKEELGSKDGRFVDLFEEAESIAGFNLKDVAKPSQPIPGLDEFVRNVVENSRVAFRSDNLLLKSLGAIAMIGSGALDTLTTILRPTALREQLEGLREMIDNISRSVEEKGLVGLGEELGKITGEVFGNPENLLYTVGAVLGAIAVSKIMGKLPLPSKLKVFVVDALQGDPVGLALDSVEAIGVGRIISNTLISKPSSSVVEEAVSGLHGKIMKEAVENMSGVEKSVLKDLAEAIRKDLAKTIRSMRGDVVDLSKLKNTLADLIRRHSIDELVSDASRLRGIRAKILGSLELRPHRIGEEYIEAMHRLGKLVDALKETTVYKVLKNIDKLSESLSELKNIVLKYGDEIGEETATRIGKMIDELEEYIRNGELGKLSEAYKSLNDFLAGEIPFSRLVEKLKENLPSTVAKEIGSVESPLDLVLLIDRVGKDVMKELNPDLLRAFSRISDIVGEIEDTGLGKTMRYLYNRVVKKLSEKIVDLSDEALSEYVLETSMEIRKADLPENVKSYIDELVEKASKKKVSLKDIERLGDMLSEIKPKEASRYELGAIKKLLDYARERLEEIKESVPEQVAKRLAKVEKDILEIENRYFGSYARIGKALAVSPISKTLLDSMNELLDYFEKTDPSIYEKLNNAFTKYVEELRSGKLSKKTLIELFKAVDESIDKLSPGLLEKLGKVFSRLRDLDEKRWGRGWVKPIRELSDKIYKDITGLLKEMEEKGKWGTLSYRVAREKIDLKHVFDPETARILDKALSNPAVEVEVDVGGLKIKGRREITVKPTGEYSIKYTLTFPENRVAEYYMVARPVKASGGKAYFDIYTRVYYDPQVLELVSSIPQLKHVFETGELWRLIEPDGELTRLRILPLGGNRLLTLGDIEKLAFITAFNQSIASLLPRDPETLREIITTLEKAPDINPPHIDGIVPIAVKNVNNHKFIIGIPKPEIINRITGYVKVKINDKIIKLPKITINDQDYILVPTIAVHTKQAPTIKEKQVETPESPVKPRNPPPANVPITVSPYMAPPTPRLGSDIRLKNTYREGGQYEIISL